MSKPSNFFTSSIGKKVTIALTGLFLCVFLVGHLVGNLQLIFFSGEEGRIVFNEYAHFMTTNPAVKVLSYLTYFSILFHAIRGILITVSNKSARPKGYAKNKASANSSWISRAMAPLGMLILAFIVLHLLMFWKKMHFGPIEDYTLANGDVVKDLYPVVIEAFKQPLYVAIYVLCMLPIGFHLIHGFKSGFQTLGLNHPRYSPMISMAGIAFATLIPLAFAIIPIVIYVRETM